MAGGDEIWRFETGNFVNASPTVVDGAVYIGSSDNNVYAIDATDGTEQWRFQTDDRVDGGAAVIDGTVFVGSYDGYLYALDASDGTEIWRYQSGVSIGWSCCKAV